MKITLTNDFHGSHVTLNANVLSHIHNVATAYLTANQIKKARRELCGISACTCGENSARTRGRQELENGKRLEINCDAYLAN